MVELQPVALTHVVVALRVDHGVDMVYATGLDSREGDVAEDAASSCDAIIASISISLVVVVVPDISQAISV